MWCYKLDELVELLKELKGKYSLFIYCRVDPANALTQYKGPSGAVASIKKRSHKTTGTAATHN